MICKPLPKRVAGNVYQTHMSLSKPSYCGNAAKGINGGELLSQKYVNYASKLIWRCKAGHQWSAPLARISSGRWCPACAKNQKKNIEEMQQAAKARNGECLSKKYVNSETPLRWRCHKGHEWEARSGNVIGNNSWCPMCNKSRKKTIEE